MINPNFLKIVKASAVRTLIPKIKMSALLTNPPACDTIARCVLSGNKGRNHRAKVGRHRLRRSLRRFLFFREEDQKESQDEKC